MTVLTVPFIAQQMLDAGVSLREAREMMDRQMIEAALRKTKGNKLYASRILRIHRNNFDRRLAQLGINFKTFRYPVRRANAAAAGNGGSTWQQQTE